MPMRMRQSFTSGWRARTEPTQAGERVTKPTQAGRGRVQGRAQERKGGKLENDNGLQQVRRMVV